jgi:hypothetical protein
VVLARNRAHSKAQNYTMLLPCSYWRPCTTLFQDYNCPHVACSIVTNTVPSACITSRSRSRSHAVVRVFFAWFKKTLRGSYCCEYAPPRRCASSCIWLRERTVRQYETFGMCLEHHMRIFSRGSSFSVALATMPGCRGYKKHAMMFLR